MINGAHSVLLLAEGKPYEKKKESEVKRNKAISMMRGKSPPSDVEMSKNLILAAILDFWRPSWINNG